MIFRVYEHYDDNQPINNSCDKPDDCFICYEFVTNYEPCTISLRCQVNYDKTCGCDGWIHKKCLERWYLNQKKCPICRLAIYERQNTVYSILNITPYANRIYICARNSFYRIVTVFAYVFFVFSVIEFYLSILMKKYQTEDKYYNQNNVPYSDLEFNHSELVQS
jgi:hypothetical protein